MGVCVFINCSPIYFVYAGGIDSDNIRRSFIQSIPIAFFCVSFGMFHRPISTVPRQSTLACPLSLERPPGNRFGSHIVWLHSGCVTGKEVSNNLCLLTSSSNIEPHKTIGEISGEPSTFSITHGLPDAIRAFLVGSIKSSYFSFRFFLTFPYFVKC